MEAVMQYFPQRANPAQWQVIRQFVAACVLDYRPRTAQVAGDLMSTLTHYVLWAVSEAHASLDRDDLFYPMMIRRYINAIARTASSKRTYASRLYRIANVIGGLPDKSRPTTSDRGHTVRTYSNRELGDIDGWISVRKTATKRRDARIAVGLAGGAGLRTHEMFTLRHSDIQRTGARVQVTVGSENRRTVDVHDDWTWYFDDLLDEPPTSDAAVLKGTTTAGSFTKVLGELLRGPHPAPNLTQLRETWVIRALGTLPVADFLRQSGFTSAASLTRYLPYLTTGETNR
ncbi:hypothetical protein DEJ01_09755 [Curtobacterium sp. MCLR17_040]|nr:hypothetical protein DEJ01_09755 [Curtobacterium sp. MCLR17_040]